MGIKNTTFLIFSLFVLVNISQPIQAADPASMSIEDISSCMRVNIFEKGAVRDFQIKARDREGKSKTLKFKIFWKPSKTDDDVRINMKVVEPDNVAGTTYLLTRDAGEEQLYIYLRAVERVRRIAGGEISQKLWGSDLTIADIKQIQGLLLEGNVQRKVDQKIDGRPVYLLETTTNMELTGYRMVRSYVDQESCVLFKAELFANGNEPQKVLEADISTLMEIDPWWLVLGYRMTDNRAGSSTEILLSDIFIQEQLPESLFTLEGFYSNRE